MCGSTQRKMVDITCLHHPSRTSKQDPITDIMLWVEQCFSIQVGILTIKYQSLPQNSWLVGRYAGACSQCVAALRGKWLILHAYITQVARPNRIPSRISCCGWNSVFQYKWASSQLSINLCHKIHGISVDSCVCPTNLQRPKPL